MLSPTDLSSFGPMQGTAVAARDGDVEAQGRLLQAFRCPSLHCARKRLNNFGRRNERESDVVQDALLKAIEGIEAFQGCTPGQLEAWLLAIVDRTVKDLVCHSQAAKRDDRREVSAAGLEGSVRHAAPAAAEVAADAEQREILRQALLRLPIDDAEVLRLRDYEKLPWQEVGRRMGRSAGAACQLHRRALRRLGELMQEHR